MNTLEQAYILFPVDPEYCSEPREDGSYPVIDMNEKKRDAWMEAQENVINPPLPAIAEYF